MLPPVLEIYVVHHKLDDAGRKLARGIFEHFHGTSFSGLLGGAVEVYFRSQEWTQAESAPRPLIFPGEASPNGLDIPDVVAVVPIISVALAKAVQNENAWQRYLERIIAAHAAKPSHVGVFPVSVGPNVTDDNLITQFVQKFQRIGAPSGLGEDEPFIELCCRDLSQGIAQLLRGSESRLQVFISHTRRSSKGEDVPHLIRLVREIIAETRLRQFFDANDLQPGRDWDEDLRRSARGSALLALRTDLYASRAWCQREMLIAKQAGMPIVILDSLGRGEERGSFLMDHVPRIPVHDLESPLAKADIRRSLNLLVDECLKQALWDRQHRLVQGQNKVEISWWAPHAPEPITIAHWLSQQTTHDGSTERNSDIRVLHPDPPLGPDEYETLAEMVKLMGHHGSFDVMTPRTLSARGA